MQHPLGMLPKWEGDFVHLGENTLLRSVSSPRCPQPLGAKSLIFIELDSWCNH